jgi:hypothetical protein
VRVTDGVRKRAGFAGRPIKVEKVFENWITIFHSTHNRK